MSQSCFPPVTHHVLKGPQTTSAQGTKVLAFTTSRDRSMMLRHCLMQMQQQTVVLDHAIYINTLHTREDNPETLADTSNYISMLNDIQPAANSQIMMAFGKTRTPHQNHCQAISLAPIEDYDIFLKIDDDDLYRTDYVAAVIEDYQQHHWDFSGTHSEGVIQEEQWQPRMRLRGMQHHETLDAGVVSMMSSSFAFSRKAIQRILNLEIPGNEQRFEDILWRRALTAMPDISIRKRAISRMSYRAHRGSFCGSFVTD